MSTIIRSIDPMSPAQRAGVMVGEQLLEISGHSVVDVLDYRFFGYDPDPVLKLKKPDGSCRSVRVEKEEGLDLGLNFDTYLMDKARSCANHCIFCFVDQVPKGMRKTLYFKDDDARLSFLMGNYLTLTNLSEREVQRIIDLRISPINVSVHTTDPMLREKMLRNPRAGTSLDILRRFAENRITMNCQIVSCPGINDGAALNKTLRDLAALYPSVQSVAVVPVGITRYRDGLYPLRPYTPKEAAALIDQVEAFGKVSLKERGTALAWCSDEFYLIARRPLPETNYYEDMDQLENGVGMLRLLLSESAHAIADLEANVESASFSVATGVSAAPFLQEITDRLHARCPQISGHVYPIRNRFFGETITVSGLVTGQDLMSQLKGCELGDRLLIPSNMLRSGEDVFLDDVTAKQLSDFLGVPVVPVRADSGFDLIDAMLGITPEPENCALPPEDDEYYRYNPGI